MGKSILDSVDEARLNRKSFERALKKFSRELDRAIERAYIFVSCRATDWKPIEDTRLIEDVLPWRDVPEEPKEGSDPLLDPIFSRRFDKSDATSRKPQRSLGELLVVQLVPLSSEQCRLLIREIGVATPDSFMAAVEESGLQVFTERPGDVVGLADYWKAHGRFARLAIMFEYNVSRKLAEVDPHRPDNDQLTPTKALEGAERLAAALTFCKSFTLKAPGQVPDSDVAAGAIDPALVLTEWSDAERNALLRRGVFAPSTYGRIRFHHRSTQEYLTAQWLHHRLASNCPRRSVWELLFVERYGVETLVPSLRPVAAWLATHHTDIRHEILRREPLVLIRYGDPGSLHLDVKQQILAAYARKHADADVADDILEHRAISQFSEPGLANSIRLAWGINNRADFHIDLLRIIREGPIPDCIDLARKTALDERVSEAGRIVAVEALEKCGDATGLKAVTRQLVNQSSKMTPRLASELSKSLFPAYLSTDRLLKLIEGTPETDGPGGFPFVVTELYNQCGDATTRKAFVAGLAELCLSKPFSDLSRRVSQRHIHLAEHLEFIARREVEILSGSGAPLHVVRLLMAVERSGCQLDLDEDVPLSQLVQQNRDLNRELFWADVAEVRQNRKKEDQQLTRIWQIPVSQARFWNFGPDDLSYFFGELSRRAHKDDPRISLSVIVSVLRHHNLLTAQQSRLQRLVARKPVLRADLEAFLAPAIEDELDLKHREQMQAFKEKRSVEEAANKASWMELSESLRRDASVLKDPSKLASWKGGASRLYSLTKWLEHRIGHDGTQAALQWRLLEEGFGRAVAEAYLDGMKILWRKTKPERPVRKDGGIITVKVVTSLALAGVALEAAEDVEWTSRLTATDVKTAVRHACLSEQG